MANSIGGNGGVDTSSLDHLLSQLNNILDKQSEINSTRIKPKSDDSEIKKISKSIEELRDEAKNTSRTNLELWNTNALKKQVGEAKRILGELSKSFDISKISPENVSGFEKEFLKAFATIKAYSEKYGQEISAEYQNIFNSIFKKSDVFKQDDLQKIFQKGLRAASESVKKGSWDIQFEANENWVQEQKKIYEEQAQAARESADAVKEAEKQKQEALMNTRDELVKGVKAQLEEMKSSGEGGFLEIDYDQWGKFQKSAGDMIQTLAEMGVEVRSLEDLLDSISKKVYLPKDQLGAVKQGSITDSMVGDASELDKAQQKVDELYNEIARLQNILYNSPTNEVFDEVNKDYEEARQEIERLKIEIEDLNSELRYSVDYWSWSQKIEEIERLEKKIDGLKNKLKSTGNGSGDGLSDEISKGFNSEELSSFLNILEKIEEQLRNISSTLGTVDENSGFNNMISSIDVLLSKLDEMHKKIGTGIYNINVNQGSDETTFAQDESVKSYIRDTQNRYKSAYDKVVQKAGGEELLFTRINNILNTGIDQLNEAYSSINVSQIESKEQQVYRLMDFFKILHQAMSDENFGLDLKGIRLPSSNDENFRRSIRNKSGETERRKQQRAQESLLNDESEESLPGLNQITQALERIEGLITEISQKDLFGDSLLRVSGQLDEIAAKFNNIVSDVRIINEDPIAVSNKTPVSSNEKEIEKATVAIEEEGNAAKKSAEQKEEFVLANQKVAESGVETADGIKKAVDAIKEEGKVVSENKIDTSQFESMIKISDTLRERLGGVVDVYRQVRKDSEGEDKISYRLVGENGSAWVGANGDILKEQIKTSEELTRQRKEEKEATRQAVEAERERQSLYKQMQKASSDKQSAQEKQRQSEINTLLSEQKNAYQRVWDIRKQLAKLDPDKNSEEISELERQKKLALEVYTERTKELKALDEIANSEAQNNTLLQMRQKALSEIAVIEAKNKDKTVSGDSSTKSKSFISGSDYYNTLKQFDGNNINRYKERVEAAKQAWQELNEEQRKAATSDYVQKMDNSLINMTDSLSQMTTKTNFTAEFGARIKELQDRIATFRNSNFDLDLVDESKTQKVLGDFKQIEDLYSKINAEKGLSKNINAAEQSLSKLIGKMYDFRDKNTNMSSANKRTLNNMIEQAESLTEADKKQIASLGNEFIKFTNTVKDAGQTGISFFDQVSKRAKSMSASFIGMYFSLYDWVRYIRNAVDAVVSVDTALTELRKVSNATDSQLSQSFRDSTITAKELGATITDVINSTSDWSRNGYNISESEELARVTTLYQNVGDNITQEEASQSLISTLRGFKIEATEAESIIDSFNEVANNFAIDSKGIGDALQRSAASFNAANTDMNSAIALITATNTVLQDPDRVGNMWKTVSARIRGASTELKDLGEETDEYVESTSKMRDLIKGLTGFDIMEDEKTYKNLKDIIVGIGKAYQELDDIDRAALLEGMAGKVQSNALAAALQNVDIIEEAYETAENSMGSAQKEQENYQKSIQYSLDVMSASAQSWAANLVDSGVIKWFVDLGNAIIGVSEKIGAFNTLLIGGGMIAGIQNVGRGKTHPLNVLILPTT